MLDNVHKSYKGQGWYIRRGRVRLATSSTATSAKKTNGDKMLNDKSVNSGELSKAGEIKDQNTIFILFVHFPPVFVEDKWPSKS